MPVLPVLLFVIAAVIAGGLQEVLEADVPVGGVRRDDAGRLLVVLHRQLPSERARRSGPLLRPHRRHLRRSLHDGEPRDQGQDLHGASRRHPASRQTDVRTDDDKIVSLIYMHSV